MARPFADKTAINDSNARSVACGPGLMATTSTTEATLEIPAAWQEEYIEIEVQTADCWVVFDQVTGGAPRMNTGAATTPDKSVPREALVGQTKAFVVPRYRPDGATAAENTNKMYLRFRAKSGTGEIRVYLA